MDRLIDTSTLPDPLHPQVGDVYGRALGGDDLPQRVVVSEIFANGQIHIMADGHERSCSNWRLFLASIPGLAQIGRVRMHGPCMICGASRLAASFVPSLTRSRIAPRRCAVESALVSHRRRSVMHPDTYRLLKFSTDQVRGMLTKDEDYDLTWLSGLAQAENLLAAHNAAQAPSSWARINVMGHDSFAGVVTRIPGGYRIVYLDDSRYDADAPVERTRDIYAIHSIEWMTEMEHSKHVAAVHAGAAERVKQRLRSTTMPEGYKLMVVASSPVYGSLAFLRLSDGKARGYFRTTEDARHGAWQCADASRCVDGGGEYDEFGDEAWLTDPDLVEFVETSE